ncbi:MAG: hypothetical protein SNJ77_13065 [Cytophagales bacterium]
MNLINNLADTYEIASHFQQSGALFFLNHEEMIEKLKKLRVLVFDWDGVFNNGNKGLSSPSTFSEPDISGINLLRYSLYRITGEIPSIVIITGEANENSVKLANRENYNLVYQKVVNKVDACIDMMSKLNIIAGETACIFDDFNDASMAKICSLRFMIRRESSPLFHSFLVKNGWCDYITANQQPNNPIREIAELCMGMLGVYDEIATLRTNFDKDYVSFMKQRSQIKPEFFALSKGTFVEVVL